VCCAVLITPTRAKNRFILGIVSPHCALVRATNLLAPNTVRFLSEDSLYLHCRRGFGSYGLGRQGFTVLPLQTTNMAERLTRAIMTKESKW